MVGNELEGAVELTVVDAGVAVVAGASAAAVCSFSNGERVSTVGVTASAGAVGMAGEDGATGRVAGDEGDATTVGSRGAVTTGSGVLAATGSVVAGSGVKPGSVGAGVVGSMLN
jgi:hypothetical protein